MSQNLYELQPRYTTQKSFNGKAMVGIMGNASILYSYGTKVAVVFSGMSKEEDVAVVYNVQSPTTVKHVKEFLKHFGFKAENKKQIVADYMENGGNA